MIAAIVGGEGRGRGYGAREVRIGFCTHPSTATYCYVSVVGFPDRKSLTLIRRLQGVLVVVRSLWFEAWLLRRRRIFYIDLWWCHRGSLTHIARAKPRMVVLIFSLARVDFRTRTAAETILPQHKVILIESKTRMWRHSRRHERAMCWTDPLLVLLSVGEAKLLNTKRIWIQMVLLGIQHGRGVRVVAIEALLGRKERRRCNRG